MSNKNHVISMCENAVKVVDLQSLTALHSFEEVLLLLILLNLLKFLITC